MTRNIDLDRTSIQKIYIINVLMASAEEIARQVQDIKSNGSIISPAFLLSAFNMVYGI